MEKLRDLTLFDLGELFVYGADRRRVRLMAIRTEGIEFIDCLSGKTYVAKSCKVSGDSLVMEGVYEKV